MLQMATSLVVYARDTHMGDQHLLCHVRWIW